MSVYYRNVFNKINHKKISKISTVDYCLIIIKHRYFNSKGQIQMLAQCIQEEKKDTHKEE